MAVAFRAVSAMGSGTTSLTMTTPAGAQTNDVLIAFIADQSTIAGSVTPPAGWTQNTSTNNASGRALIFSAIVGTGGVTANQSSTWTGLTGNSVGAIAAYSGVFISPLTLDGLNARVNASGTVGAPQITTLNFGALVVVGFASTANGSTWSGYACGTNPTSGFTERLDAANGTTNSIAIADAPRNPATSGATGNSTATMATPGVNAGLIVGLRPFPLAPNSTTDGVTANDVDALLSLVQFRDVSAVGSGTTSMVLTTPAKAQSGDVLLAVVGDRGTTSTATAAPAGWTSRVANGTTANGGRIQVFSAIVGQGGVTASQATTFTGFTTSCIGIIGAYSGVDNVNPVDAITARTNPSGSTGAATITATSWGALAVAGFVSFTNGSTWSAEAFNTNPTAAFVTQRGTGASATPMSIDLADGLRSPRTAGITGASTATMGTAGANAGANIVLRSNNVGSTTDGPTSGFVTGGAGLFSGNTTDGVTSADAASGSQGFAGSTSDGVTTSDVASSRLIAVGSTTTGVTAAFVSSGTVTAGGTVYNVSTTTGVTTAFVASAAMNFAVSTTTGVTAAFVASVNKVFSVSSTTTGVTAGFVAGVNKVFSVSSTTTGVTAGFAASVAKLFVGSTADGITAGFSCAARMIFTAQTVDNVFLSFQSSGFIFGQIPGVWCANPYATLRVSVQSNISSSSLFLVSSATPVMVPRVQTNDAIVVNLDTKVMGTAYDSIQR